MSDTLLQCVTPSADAAGVRAWEAIDLGADAAAVARVASLTGDATIASGVLSLTQVRTSERRGALLLRAWGRYPALRTLRVQVNPDPNPDPSPDPNPDPNPIPIPNPNPKGAQGREYGHGGHRRAAAARADAPLPGS